MDELIFADWQMFQRKGHLNSWAELLLLKYLFVIKLDKLIASVSSFKEIFENYKKLYHKQKKSKTVIIYYEISDFSAIFGLFWIMPNSFCCLCSFQLICVPRSLAPTLVWALKNLNFVVIWFCSLIGVMKKGFEQRTKRQTFLCL